MKNKVLFLILFVIVVNIPFFSCIGIPLEDNGVAQVRYDYWYKFTGFYEVKGYPGEKFDIHIELTCECIVAPTYSKDVVEYVIVSEYKDGSWEYTYSIEFRFGDFDTKQTKTMASDSQSSYIHYNASHITCEFPEQAVNYIEPEPQNGPGSGSTFGNGSTIIGGIVLLGIIIAVAYGVDKIQKKEEPASKYPSSADMAENSSTFDDRLRKSTTMPDQQRVLSDEFKYKRVEPLVSTEKSDSKSPLPPWAQKKMSQSSKDYDAIDFCPDCGNLSNKIRDNQYFCANCNKIFIKRSDF